MAFKLIIAIILCGVSARTDAAEISVGTRELAKATLNQEVLATPSGRSALLKAVNAYCKEIQAIDPRNSPSEDQWVDGEISGAGNRIEKVLSSAELGRRIAKNFSDNCVTSSDWALKRPDRTLYVISLTHDFIRFSRDATYFAKKNGVNPEIYWLDGMPRSAAEALAYAAMMIEVPNMERR